MNGYYLVAAILTAAALIGHLTVANRDFLKPILQSNHPQITKGVTEALFHYMTFFSGLTVVLLLAFSFNLFLGFSQPAVVANFTGVIWLGLGIICFGVACKYGLMKLFQWILWFAIGLLCVIGSM